MSPSIILVSNRLPITVKPDETGEFVVQQSTGGLVSGLTGLHEQAQSLWIGHLGIHDQPTPHLVQKLKDQRLVHVPIEEEAYQNYYNGYANGTLWPLFHNFLATMSISDQYWKAYQEVNQQFAEVVLSQAKKDCEVWVHDYQLILLPKLLREQRPDLKISYFHHIPFPSIEIFRTIPRRLELIEGFLGADYLGFHTFDYANHFIQAVQRITGSKTKVNEVYCKDRPIKVATHPLGVDFKMIDQRSSYLMEHNPIQRKPGITVLGIDRLDYTKGLPERLKSFREFLHMFPDQIGKVRLIQLCVPSRQDIDSYGEIRSEVEQLVGQINGEFGSPGYTPIEYLFRSLPFDQVIELYQSADVMLVTPLRDGLNLVCKEYIAARHDLDGCLILSEFAGAAAEMGEAIQVNPYDVKAVACAIEEAIRMPKDEKTRRMKALRKRVALYDNATWAQDFVAKWRQHHEESMFQSIPMDRPHQKALLSKIDSANRVFLFVDYDGTLTPIVSHPDLAIPGRNVQALLESLAAKVNTHVTIVTGRPKAFCERYLSIEGVNMVCEHGAFIKPSGTDEWHSPVLVPEEEVTHFRTDILNIFDRTVQLVPGSHVEKKETCIVWHYREAEQDFASQQAHELGATLQQSLAKTPFSVYHGKKSLEIRFAHSHKGYGVEYFLEQNLFDPESDVLVTIGDDVTDEDMHRVYLKDNVSIHIGKANAYSKYYLPGPRELQDLLRQIESTRSR